MRFARSHVSTLLSCITAVLISFLALLPSACAQGQEATFLVHRSKDPKQTQIWIASCPNINLTAEREQKLTCTFARNKCKQGECKFTTTPSINEAPVPLVFGISRFNPTCVWVFDPMRFEYTAYCWD